MLTLDTYFSGYPNMRYGYVDKTGTKHLGFMTPSQATEAALQAGWYERDFTLIEYEVAGC